ncbi:hypothetical protein [Microbacterium sp. NPDC089695]|uniref:hypothetical protein n=1 Tax=Microbacterium sp. NPDC089695 TaxID=3364198 RepID=UPI00381DCACD
MRKTLRAGAVIVVAAVALTLLPGGIGAAMAADSVERAEIASITTEQLQVLTEDLALSPAVYTIRRADFVFLTTIDPATGEKMPIASAEAIDWSTVALQRCSMVRPAVTTPPPRAGQPRPAAPDWARYCADARMAEFTWLDGAAMGVPVYYAHELDGRLVCISATGTECLRSAPGVDMNAQSDRLLVKTASCVSSEPAKALAEQCRLLRNALRSPQLAEADGSYARQLARMDRLFWQALNEATSRVERQMNYTTRLAELTARAADALKAQRSSCPSGKGNGICNRARDARVAADEEVKAFTRERNDKVSAAQSGARLHMAEDWHRLHESWAASDDTHFAALMRVESKELAELKTIRDAYAQAAADDHAAYVALEEEWKRTRSGIEAAESIPLIGPLIRRIEAYEANPTGANLRKIFLGGFGLAGEAVEGAVELTAEGKLSDEKQAFLMKALQDVATNSDFGTALEAIASDFERDLGDEAVEGVRQTGLWSSDGSAGMPPSSPFRDFAHLRAEAPRMQIFDWLAKNDQAAQFRSKFTPPAGAAAFADPVGDEQTIADMRPTVAFERGIEAVFAHAMGAGYADVAHQNPTYAGWDQRRVTRELIKVVTDKAYIQQIEPRWVTSSTLGDRPAGMIFDADHAVIVLNSDRVSADSPELGKYYFEELGHLANWWRCEIFDVPIAACTGQGDVGARFRDAVMLDPTLSTEPLSAQLLRLPEHAESDLGAVTFADRSVVKMEGWSSFRTLNQHLAGRGKFSFLMRAGIDLESRYPGLSDEFDLEMVVGAPSMTKLGDPWKTSSKGECAVSDLGTAKDCNVPTLTMAFAFRDVIKASVTSMPKVKDSRVASSGIVDLSPSLIRKHGVRLFFQPRPGDFEGWELKAEHSIYFKEFSASLDAKLDFSKVVEAATDRKLPAPHTLQLASKAAVEGLYVVEIPTNDKDLLALWLSLDVGSAALGCVAGIAVAAVAEQDPLAFCHAGSDVVEGIETALESFDKRSTALFAVDTTVAVPLSIEYKVAVGAKPTSQTGAPRVWPHDDIPLDHIITGGAVPDTPVRAQPASVVQAKTFGTKVSSAFKKLKETSLTGLVLFRPRVGWDIADRVINRGDHLLPSSSIKE